ncbi:porin [Pollutimonas nitritireducens]|uniref:Porin n=1 Tax=Pollutimonas nitritireducens TaxID=2045209 RepID=A0A2N4UFV7_9BURK|nr:porin [Pollutimonas nitritireducens]PLC53890.1 porin [Pollutimonas nitritireducens]
MKKTLLAAALIAGFAGVAQAETSVTLYGILDGGIGYNKVDGTVVNRTTGVRTDYSAKKTGMINGVQSGNRWGLKGSEDLGNGLRAVFQLESGFDLGTGNSAQGGRLFGRQATLGLAGDSWGQLDVGRQTNIASKYLPGVADPFGAGFGQANIGTSFSAANTMRWDNLVMYQTPNFSGFQFGVGYSFNVSGNQGWDIDRPGLVNNPDEANGKGITTGLRYANGPIGVAATYDRIEFDADDAKFTQWNLGASYDFEVVKAMVAFGQTRDGWFQGTDFGPAVNAGGVADTSTGTFRSLDGLKVNSYLVGLTAPIGNGKLLASWQMADPSNSPDGALGEFEKQHTYSLGYTYALSKRTNVYAIGSYAKNVVFQDDLDSTLVGVGLRHQF